MSEERETYEALPFEDGTLDLNWQDTGRMWVDPQSGETMDVSQAMALIVADLSDDQKYLDTPIRDVARNIASALDKVIADLHSVEDAVIVRGTTRHIADMLKERGADMASANIISRKRLQLERTIGEDLKVNVRAGNPAGGRTLPQGISAWQSSDWQRLADIPPDEFESYIDLCFENEKEITTSGALRVWERLFAEAQSTDEQPGDGIPADAPPDPADDERAAHEYVCPDCGAQHPLSNFKVVVIE